MSKGKKGIKKRTVDPFTRKDEYSVKVGNLISWIPGFVNKEQAPSTFQTRE